MVCTHKCLEQTPKTVKFKGLDHTGKEVEKEFWQRSPETLSLFQQSAGPTQIRRYRLCEILGLNVLAKDWPRPTSAAHYCVWPPVKCELRICGFADSTMG